MNTEDIELNLKEYTQQILTFARELGVYESDDFPKFTQYWESYFNLGLTPHIALIDFMANMGETYTA